MHLPSHILSSIFGYSLDDPRDFRDSTLTLIDRHPQHAQQIAFVAQSFKVHGKDTTLAMLEISRGPQEQIEPRLRALLTAATLP